MPGADLDGASPVDPRSQEVAQFMGRKAVDALAHTKQQPFLGSCIPERVSRSDTKASAGIEQSTGDVLHFSQVNGKSVHVQILNP